jgi:hypothetical protein
VEEPSGHTAGSVGREEHETLCVIVAVEGDIERTSPSDLLGSIGRAPERFVAEAE